MIAYLILAGLMSWVGTSWLPAGSTEWVITQLPLAVLLAGFLFRESPAGGPSPLRQVCRAVVLRPAVAITPTAPHVLAAWRVQVGQMGRAA